MVTARPRLRPCPFPPLEKFFRLPSWIVIAIVFALALAGGPACADDDSPDADLAAVRTELTTIQRSLHDGSTDAELLRYRASALAQQTKAADIATRLAPQLAS